MNGKASLLIACLLLGLLVVSASLAHEALQRWQAEAARPETVTDIVMRSRQTLAVSREPTTNWLGAGLLALVIVLMSGTLFMMRGGADLLKQWRLTQKGTSRPRPLASAPTVTYTDPSQVPYARPVSQPERKQDETIPDTPPHP